MTAGQIALNIAIVLGSILALWIGADFFVASAARIARKMGMSELVIGLTIVAMGTSAPEFAVTALAAWHGTASIPIGNVAAIYARENGQGMAFEVGEQVEAPAVPAGEGAPESPEPPPPDTPPRSHLTRVK